VSAFPPKFRSTSPHREAAQAEAGNVSGSALTAARDPISIISVTTFDRAQDTR
jgi:hypothetical protein